MKRLLLIAVTVAASASALADDQPGLKAFIAEKCAMEFADLMNAQSPNGPENEDYGKCMEAAKKEFADRDKG